MIWLIFWTGFFAAIFGFIVGAIYRPLEKYREMLQREKEEYDRYGAP